MTNHITVEPDEQDKNQLWCQASDCEDPINENDDVVWTNYRKGEVYHRECYTGDDT